MGDKQDGGYLGIVTRTARKLHLHPVRIKVVMLSKFYERADVYMADFDHLGEDEALVNREVMSIFFLAGQDIGGLEQVGVTYLFSVRQGGLHSHDEQAGYLLRGKGRKPTTQGI